MRNAAYEFRGEFRTPHSELRMWKGQASLETTVALVGAILLLFASVKVFLWISERLVRRQQYYNCTRAMSASQPGRLWDDRADPANRIALSFFHAQAVSPNPCPPVT